MMFRQSDSNRRRMATKRPNSKAEVVRTRRSNITGERLEKKVQQVKMSSANVPVITMRAGAMGTPVVRRASTRPRLKLNLPVNQHGVEMRLPAIPVIRPSWRFLSGFLVILLSAVIIYLTTSKDFVVKAPQITGITRLNSADLGAALSMSDMRIFMVDPLEVKTTLEASFPELKNVSVEVAFPAKVSIKAIEREPIVTWKYQDVVMWVDNEGIIFPARGDVPDLLTITSDAAPPMVQGEQKPALLTESTPEASQEGEKKKGEPENPKMFVDRTVLNMAIRLSKDIPTNTTLVYNQNNGLGWLDPNGWNVYVGFDLDQLEQKMLVYQKLVDTLSKQGLHPQFISVEYVNAPFYRLE